MKGRRRASGIGRAPGRRAYLALPEQSLLITRTELTRRCCWLPDMEPDVEPLVAELVEPELELVGELEEVPDALVSSVPVTSTRLPTSDDRSEELPLNT